MRPELVLLAVIVGFATWLFRFVPTRMRLSQNGAPGPLRRFLVATGPAAIATLFTASILPMMGTEIEDALPLVCGIAAVLLAYFFKPSVVLSTLAGVLAYGLATFWLG